MNKNFKRFLATLLCVATLLPWAQISIPEADAAMLEHENTYVNTGDQRKDILGVALTQLGYSEIGFNGKNSEGNDTKYGTWYGLPYNPWCAMFVTWCARQADIPTDVLKRSAKADPRSGYFGISTFYSNSKTPQPGDLFFTTGNTHVGLVYYVEGEYFYTIEGNSNPDHSTDGYCVISNKRKLSGFKFASPKYQGGGSEHTYVKKQESAHPHKTYYQCTHCSASHYTGNTVCVKGCSQCFSCGCSTASAGYYICDVKGSNGKSSVASVRNGHVSSTDKTRVGYVGDGMVVYVHGFKDGYAYIEYDNLRGHILSKYLKPYYPAPGAPTVTSDKDICATGQTVNVTWSAPSNTEEYKIRIFKDSQLFYESKTGERSYALKNAEVGEYEVQVIAGNRTGSSPAGATNFSVRNLYSVIYDPAGGTGAPDAASQISGLPVTIPQQTPTREGYEFLGWTTTQGGLFAELYGGDSVTGYQHMMLYAVWKQKSANATQFTMQTPPLRTTYLIGDELNTEGVLLEVQYSDGTGHFLREGFTASGFDTDSLGEKTVTLEYGGLSVSYTIQVVEHIPGDVNDDRLVNSLDGLLLLRYLNGWELEINRTESLDVNADQIVNSLDGLLLLRYLNGWDVTLR